MFVNNDPEAELFLTANQVICEETLVDYRIGTLLEKATQTVCFEKAIVAAQLETKFFGINFENG